MRDWIDASLKKVYGAVNSMQARLSQIESQHQLVQQLLASQRSITAEIDAIPGRRLYYNLNGTLQFTSSDDGLRAQPINMLVSQDGPFIQTHYPFALWRPSEPSGATMFGLWRPVTTFPLPDQFSGGGVDGDEDLVSISYEVNDSGSQRNFQNEPTPPILSRPDTLIPLPVPTLFTPNTTVQFIATFERILFNNSTTPPTAGTLVVALPGYRIVNM